VGPTAQHYEFGPIDWSEFNAVLKATARAIASGFEARRRAWEEGGWVRDAAMAHAEKQRRRQVQAA